MLRLSLISLEKLFAAFLIPSSDIDSSRLFAISTNDWSVNAKLPLKIDSSLFDRSRSVLQYYNLENDDS